MITGLDFVSSSDLQSREMIGSLLWGMSPSIPTKQKWIIDAELDKSPYTLEYLRENIVNSYSSSFQSLGKNIEFAANSGDPISHYPQTTRPFNITRLFGRCALNNIDNNWSSWMSPDNKLQIGVLSMIPIYKAKTIDLALFIKPVHSPAIRIDIFSFCVDMMPNVDTVPGDGENISTLFLQIRHFKPDLHDKSSSHSLGLFSKPISYISDSLGLKKHSISSEIPHQAASTWLLAYLATSGFRAPGDARAIGNNNYG